MNTDIRISLCFPTHRKTLKLIRRCGPEAPWVLVKLWIYVAQHLPDGVLTGMDEEDIEIAAGWTGEPGAFTRALIESKYLDQDNNGVVSCHDWLEHNPWVAGSDSRSDASRFSKLSTVARPLFEELQHAGIRGIGKRDYEIVAQAAKTGKRLADISNTLAIFGDRTANASGCLAPAPSPVPSPSPLPEPSQKEKKASQLITTEVITATQALAPSREQAGETPCQAAIRREVKKRRDFIRNRWPDVDVELETERMVAKAARSPVIDPAQYVLAWFPLAKPTRAVMTPSQIDVHNRRAEAEFLEGTDDG